jgi:AcrR family transcriptional regulator
VELTGQDSSPEGGGLSRKEREKLARQQDILRAAQLLFTSKGYHETTLEEIAHHAEFAKGTIYNYFSSKEELLFGIVDSVRTEFLEMARTTISSTPGGAREKLTAYAQSMVAHAQANHDLLHLIMRELHRNVMPHHEEKFSQLLESMRQVWGIIAVPLAEEMDQHRIRRTDPLKLAAVFEGMVRVSCAGPTIKIWPITSASVDEAIAFVVSVFFDGIVERTPNRTTP